MQLDSSRRIGKQLLGPAFPDEASSHEMAVPPTRKMFVVVALATVACVLAVASITAPVVHAANATASTAENCGSYHAGTVEGDGEYSDGAMLAASGISCRSAFALVKSRYHWVLRREQDVSLAGKLPKFRLGSFRCRFSPTGPDTLKICVSRSARFTFV